MKDNPGLLRLDRVDGLVARKVSAETNNALCEANLPQPLVALLPGHIFRRPCSSPVLAGVAAALYPRVGVDGRVVDDLVVEGVVGVAQAGVEDGEEADLGGNDCVWGRCGC